MRLLRRTLAMLVLSLLFLSSIFPLVAETRLVPLRISGSGKTGFTLMPNEQTRVFLTNFLNDGHGHFSEKMDSGLVRRFGSTSMALADIDGDGDLDLYVANYRTTSIMDEPGVRFTLSTINGQPVVTKVNGVPTSSPELE